VLEAHYKIVRVSMRYETEGDREHCKTYGALGMPQGKIEASSESNLTQLVW
jgi:hypothetical protein